MTAWTAGEPESTFAAVQHPNQLRRVGWNLFFPAQPPRERMVQ